MDLGRRREAAADSEPARQQVPVLHPREDPGNRAQILDPAAGAAGGGPGPYLETLDDVDGGGEAEVAVEVGVVVDQAPEGCLSGGRGGFHSGGPAGPGLVAQGADGARLEDRSGHELEGSQRDPAQAILRVNDLALLGHPQTAANNPRRLGEDAGPRLAAAAARGAAAAVEEGQLDPGIIGGGLKSGLGLVEGPARRGEARLLARVRVAEHDDLPVAACRYMGTVEGIIEQRGESLSGMIQICDSLEQWRHVEGHGTVAADEPRAPGQVQHRQRVVGPLRHGDDVGADRFRSEDLPGLGNATEYPQSLCGFGLPVFLDDFDRLQRAAQGGGASFGAAVHERRVRQQLTDNSPVDEGILAHVQGGEVEAEGLDPEQQPGGAVQTRVRAAVVAQAGGDQLQVSEESPGRGVGVPAAIPRVLEARPTEPQQDAVRHVVVTRGDALGDLGHLPPVVAAALLHDLVDRDP